MKKIARGFIYAYQGIRYAFRTQINFKIHTLAIVVAVSLGLSLRLHTGEWLWITASAALVIISELFNTALETLVDMVSPEYNKKAGIVKDLSAGAVLLSAFFAVIVALLIFVPKLSQHAP